MTLGRSIAEENLQTRARARTKMTGAIAAPTFSCVRAIRIAVPAARSRLDRTLERCSRGPRRELARDESVLRSHAPWGRAVYSFSASRSCRPFQRSDLAIAA